MAMVVKSSPAAVALAAAYRAELEASALVAVSAPNSNEEKKGVKPVDDKVIQARQEIQQLLQSAEPRPNGDSVTIDDGLERCMKAAKLCTFENVTPQLFVQVANKIDQLIKLKDHEIEDSRKTRNKEVQAVLKTLTPRQENKTALELYVEMKQLFACRDNFKVSLIERDDSLRGFDDARLDGVCLSIEYMHWTHRKLKIEFNRDINGRCVEMDETMVSNFTTLPRDKTYKYTLNQPMLDEVTQTLYIMGWPDHQGNSVESDKHHGCPKQILARAQEWNMSMGNDYHPV